MNIYLEQLSDDKTYHEHEKNTLDYWKQIDVNKKMENLNNNNQLFRFIDGPPFASNNALHMGHLLISYLKSTVLQYQRMVNNMQILQKIGYDTHGLPIEMQINKQINKFTKKEIEEYGIHNYNGACKSFVNSCAGSWTPIFERIGRIADYNNNYKTMDTTYMETEWWVFNELWKKGLIYKSYKIMPFSTSCETSLSNFEAGEMYKEIDSKSIYICFKLKNEENVFFVAWTTTPWTLPANLALCVNPDVEYVKVQDIEGKSYIVSRDCVNNLNIQIIKVEHYKYGKDMLGLEYEPLFNYMKRDNFKVITGDYVEGNCKVGTGIVHLAPAHGLEDYEVCIKHKIINAHDVGNYCHVDDQGRYTNQIKEFEGKYVFDVTDDIIKNLKKRNLHLKTESYRHKYPHCYRTETPLIYKAVSSFFVKTTLLKNEMIKNNEKVNWYPESANVRHKAWLENIQDWGISRSRFFGTPIPVWISDDGDEMISVGSIDELMELANLAERPTDLHREFIDNIKIPSKQGKGLLSRTSFVLDCWFDSACVPYGQIHYPFENKNAFDNTEYLSDFVCEGSDQVRLWFYVLNVISTALFNKPTFKNVICTGLIYDENGLKFSKKYGNFKDPFEMLNKYGADSLRLYLMNSPLINANPLYFTEKNIDKVKQKLIPYINAVKFFITQLTDYQKKGNTFDINKYENSTVLTDKWIISRLGSVLKFVENKMKCYQIDKCIQELMEFIEDLTNWYIKFNRERLRGLAGAEDWSVSLSTLNHVLYNFLKIMAPFTPFLSEYLYKHLKSLNLEESESVMLCTYPESTKFKFNEQIECKMVRLRQVVKLVRILRDSTKNLKTIRIPIKEVVVYHNNDEYLEDIMTIEDLAQEEMNCEIFKYKKFSENVTYNIVSNQKILGQKYKSQANLIKQNLNKIDENIIFDFANNICNEIQLVINNETFVLTREDLCVEIKPKEHDKKYVSITENDLMISIDSTYDEQSHNDYQLRLLLREIQVMRKNSKLNPWNKIIVHFKTNIELNELLEKSKLHIENKLKSSIMTNSLPEQNIYSKLNYDWTTFSGEHIEVIATIVLFE